LKYEIVNALVYGDPNILSDALILVKIGLKCTDCDSRYYSCDCEFCNDCELPSCLCDKNIKSHFCAGSYSHDFNKQEIKIRNLTWKLAKEFFHKKDLEEIKEAALNRTKGSNRVYSQIKQFKV
jgi:hypothetical protein